MTEIITKEKVNTILDSFYGMTASAMAKSVGDNAVRDELKRFCDMVKEEVRKS